MQNNKISTNITVLEAHYSSVLEMKESELTEYQHKNLESYVLKESITTQKPKYAKELSKVINLGPSHKSS